MKIVYHALIGLLITCLSFGTEVTYYGAAGEERSSSETYMVEMRDGIKLATEVYLPHEGDGPWPVKLSLSQYGRGSREENEKALSKGIAVVMQDVRGIGESEGDYCFLSSNGWGELQDGYDTVEWILAQPWCNGNISTTGGSALGLTQMLLAGTGPKGIVGQEIFIAPDGNYRTYYTGGVFHKTFVEFITSFLKLQNPSIETMRSHYTYDEYWKTQQLLERIECVNWPVFLLTGWYDIFSVKGSIEAFKSIQKHGGPKARNNVYMVIGPWGHGINNPGDFVFPEDDSIENNEDVYNWHDYWLLEKPQPDDIPPVRYYTMGENPVGNSPGNEWRTASTWPPEDSKLVSFYLNTQGNMQFGKPNESAVSFVYDPKNPAPSKGGQAVSNGAGALDQHEIEQRDDVIVFSTPVLSEPIEVTGEMSAVLYVSTSAVDTDFVAKVCDVYPDGRSMILTHGIRRLSFRNTLEKHELANPGDIYKLEIDLLNTSMIFNKGHKIRVSITSSCAPWFEPNPNTGIPNDSIENAVKAKQTIYIGGEHASYIKLPIVGSLKGLEK